MKINSVCIPHIGVTLKKLAKKLGSKPIQDTPNMALRSPLEGLFVLSGCGLPLVLYKGDNYERKRGVRNTIRPY